jgi:hypothetical protein
MPLTSSRIGVPARVALAVGGLVLLCAGSLLLWLAAGGLVVSAIVGLPIGALGLGFLVGGVAGRNFGWVTDWADDDDGGPPTPTFPV